MNKLKKIAQNLKKKIKYYRCIYDHPDTPRSAKILLWMALGYASMPFDLIPDFIPVIGHIDDAVIIPLLLYLANKLVPEHVKNECMNK